MTDLTTLKYTPEHEWVAVVDGVATIGVTDYAVEQLGDIVYVDLPAVGTTISANDVMGEIESTKSVSELYAPVAGEVVAVNDAVDAAPETVGEDPFGAGWLLRVRVTSSVSDLLDRDAYVSLTGDAA